MRTEDIKMKEFIYIIMLTMFFTIVTGATMKSIEACISLKRSRVTYSCETGEKIHVTSILYTEATQTCLPTPGGCRLLHRSSSDGLLTQCNGYQTCDESVTDFAFKEICNNTAIATVSYECIEDESFDMCSPVATHSYNTLYLNSPRFPRNNGSGSDNVNYICVCNINGTFMNVDILGISFGLDPSKSANLTLIGDTGLWTPDSPLMYNVVLIRNWNMIDLSLDVKGQNNQDAWIRIKGIGNITVTCNDGASTTPAPPTITPPTLTSAPATSGRPVTPDSSFSTITSINQATEETATLTPAQDTSSGPTTLGNLDHTNTSTVIINTAPGDQNIGVIVGCIFGALLIIVLIIIVLFLLRRQKQRARKGVRYEDVDRDLEDYRRTLAAMDASATNEPPSSPDYAELETFRLSVNGGASNGATPAQVGIAGSSLPYTNKKLEDLYSEVIPKKFKSTRDMREPEKKKKKRSKSGGAQNLAYEDDDDAVPYTEVKDALGGTGAKGVEDRASIDQSPQIPAREYDAEEDASDGTKDEEYLNESQASDSKPRKDSGDGLVVDDGMYAAVPDIQDKEDTQLTTSEGEEDRDDGNHRGSELIMVDNDLYSGGLPRGVNQEGKKRDHRNQEYQYEEIRPSGRGVFHLNGQSEYDEVII